MSSELTCPACGADVPDRGGAGRWRVCPHCRETFDRESFHAAAEERPPVVVFEDVTPPTAAQVPAEEEDSGIISIRPVEEPRRRSAAERSATRPARAAKPARPPAPAAERRRREPEPKRAPGRPEPPRAKKRKKKPPAESADWLTDDGLSDLAWEDETAPPPPRRTPPRQTPPRRRSTREAAAPPAATENPTGRRGRLRRRRSDGGAEIGKWLFGAVVCVSLLFEGLNVLGGWEDGSWHGLGDSVRWVLLSWWYVKIAEGRNWARVCLIGLLTLSACLLGLVGLTVFVGAAAARRMAELKGFDSGEMAAIGVVMLALALLPVGQIVALCTPWVSAFMAQQRGE